ncbi:recombinase family protein [Streptomyces sp. NBC_00201]|uniref:recombinase family protein n=1 Tax=unclassified Streptomyces TaxID=2593676 RepID=UPI00224F6D6A|nr:MULTISPECIES: recombinase family protein [unclassified Streptomyces]MCX5063645.1 recombinase family protein [Streptomyces sp. NBC_00452]MCX5251800.1 recombinase family protein [Streptomyces sp. NBC_00201]MCX5294297.1 recombinase family protein [Streptomyces sp. NBC_00183]
MSGPVYLVLSPGTFERLDGRVDGAALFEVVKPALPSLARGPVGVGGDIPREIPNELEEALKTAREIKAHAPHCRVIFTVFEMKRLGRDAAELAALADHLTEHGLVLEMLAGPLPGIYDPTGPGKLLFGFFAAMAETERENIRESTLEGLDTAARKGKYGGRPRS